MFILHEQLEKDLIPVTELSLSKVFLLPDSDNPWVVIVPVRRNIREIHELSDDDQSMLIREITTISKLMEEEFNADKMNVGALGNMVPQLHIHIICRFSGDRAWPGSIWGTKSGSDNNKIQEMLSVIKEKLK